MKTNTATEPAEVTAEDLLHAERYDVGKILLSLAGHLELLTELRDTRQANRIPVLAPEVRESINRQDGADRRQRRESLIAGFPEATGATRAPVNLATATVLVEARMELTQWVRRILRGHTAAGICLIPRVAPTDDPVVLCDQLRDLVWTMGRIRNVKQLRRDVEHLVVAAQRIVDGEDRRSLPDPCPWCGRLSLVFYPEAGMTVCERKPGPGGRRPECFCPADLCPCKATGAPKFEHAWYFARRRSDDAAMYTLDRLIKARKRATP